MKKKLTFLLLLLSIVTFAQSGDNIFDDTFVHTIEINSIVPQSYDSFHDSLNTSWWDHYDEHYIDGQQRRSYFRASVTIDGNTLDTVGVRYKGVSTMEFASAIEKYPLKLDFNEYVKGQDYDGLKKINLHSNILDVSVMRAKLAFEMLSRMGVAAPRIAYAKVYLNGSFRGLYSIVEQIDKTFVRSNFSPDSTGVLHKANALVIKDDRPEIDPFNIQNTYEHHRYWNPLKTKKSTDDYQPLIDLGVTVSSATDEDFKNDIAGNFDIASFLKIQAVNVVLSDFDHYCQAAWNFSLYLNPNDNKWYMIPWDYDLAFGAQGETIDDPANYTVLSDSTRCYLNGRIMAIPELKEQYYQSLCDVVNRGMDSLWINSRIEEIKNVVALEVQNDPFYWEVPDYEMYLDQAYVASNPDPDGSLNGVTILGLRNYINNRFEQVRTSLSSQGFNCEMTTTIEEIDNSPFGMEVYPNPANDFINLKLYSDGIKVDKVVISNVLNQQVFTSVIPIAEKELNIDLSNMSNGVYFITVFSKQSSKVSTKKILIQR